MVTTTDISGPDGRTIRLHDSGGEGPVVVYHHGSPQTGAPLPPLLEATAARGVRLVSYGRAGYGGTDAVPDRTVAHAAADVAAVVDALGVDRFATMGPSGGGPHALACAALLPDRVSAVACFAGIAPPTGREDWYAGMADPSGLAAATRGRAERERHEETAEFVAASFNDGDLAALAGPWSSLGDDVAASAEWGSGGLVADDLSFVRPWGFELADVVAPVLLAQGGDDRVVPAGHAHQLLAALPDAELWLRPRDGHLAILATLPLALDWLLAQRSGESSPASVSVSG